MLWICREDKIYARYQDKSTCYMGRTWRTLNEVYGFHGNNGFRGFKPSVKLNGQGECRAMYYYIQFIAPYFDLYSIRLKFQFNFYTC